MSRQSQNKPNTPTSQLIWSPDTELVGLVFELVPEKDYYLYPQYTVGLHAWFLQQVQQSDPELSAYLHDEESEKAFTISALDGKINSNGRQLQLSANTIYRWYVTVLSRRVQEWIAPWTQDLPSLVDLRDAPLQMACNIPSSHDLCGTAQLRTSSDDSTIPHSYSFSSQRSSFSSTSTGEYFLQLFTTLE